MIGDYHTHTRASDGRSSVAENIEAAKLMGLSELAITDHSFSSMLCHMTREKYDKQAREIEKADKGGLIVLQGVEANLFADGSIDVPDDIIRRVDVLNLGFHRLIGFKDIRGSRKFIFENGWGTESARRGLIEENTRAYIKALERYPVDILCHLDHRCLVDVRRVCETAAKYGVYVELNEKHIDTLEREIDAIKASGVNFILGSDAHVKNRIGRFSKTEDFIKRHNVPIDRVFGLNGKKPAFKDKTGYGL